MNILIKQLIHFEKKWPYAQVGEIPQPRLSFLENAFFSLVVYGHKDFDVNIIYINCY